MKGTTLYAVTWSGEDGADVFVFLNEADADAKYDALCRESDVYPKLGYAAEGYTYEGPEQPHADDPTDSGDPWAGSAKYGEHQVNIEVREVTVS
jgi:hypothetical protein